MTTSLGDIDFTDGYTIQSISANKICEMMVFSIPFADSDEVEAYNWGGNIERFSINGFATWSSSALAAASMNELRNIVSEQQSTITFTDPVVAATGVGVKVENVEFGRDLKAPADLSFTFRINLVRAKAD